MERFSIKNQIKLTTVSKENSLFLASDEGLFDCDCVENTSNRVFPLTDLNMSIYDISQFFQTMDGEWYLWGVMQKTDGSNAQSSYCWFKVIPQIEETDQLTTLTLAVTGSENTYDKEIFDFQKSEQNVIIKKIQYENQDILFADLAAGNYPDMILLDDELDSDELMNKGVLADLGAFLDEDMELSREDFMSQALQTYCICDKIYAIPNYMVVTAIVGNKDFLGFRTKWTIQEFKDFITSLPNSNMVTAGMTRTDIFDCILSQNIEEYVSVADRTCSFNNDSFYDLLDFLSAYPETGGGKGNSIEEIMMMIEDEELIMMPVSIGDVQEMELYFCEFNGNCHFMEFPVQKGCGYGFLPVGKTIAITENSENKDIAWKFLKKCMTDRETGQMAFPTYLKAYEEVMEEARKKSKNDTPSFTLELGDVSIEISHLELKQINFLDQMIKNANVSKKTDAKIREIILEVSNYYFNGQKTKEEVAEIIQNRVNLYLKE